MSTGPSRPSGDAEVTVHPATLPGTLPLFPGDAIRETTVTQEKIERSRSPSLFTQNKREADKTHKEIVAVLNVLTQLEVARTSFTADDNPDDLVKNLNTDAVLRTHLIKLKSKVNVLEWRALASRPSLMHLDPVVVDKLLDIQRDSATAIGALAVVGATVAISLMYSATRGDLWYPFIAWWMFVISMATTSGLSLASSGSSISSAAELLETYSHSEEERGFARATPRNWLLQRLSVVAVAFSLIGAAGGWATLAAGAVGFNLHWELEGRSPAVLGGPDLGTAGIHLGPRLTTYLIIGIFVIVLVGGYFLRLRPRFHARRRAFAFGDPIL